MTTVEPGRAEDWAESVPSDFSTVNDAATIASLRSEVERLRRQVDYYAGQRSDMEDVAGDAQGEAHRLGTKLLDETLRADREAARAEAAEAERDALVAAMRRIGDEYDAELEPLRAALDAVRALADEWDRDYEPCGETLRAALARVSPEGREDTPNPEGEAQR